MRAIVRPLPHPVCPHIPWSIPCHSPCPSPVSSSRYHLPRNLLCALDCLMALHPLLAGTEENSSDWGQSPGEVVEPPPPHPCPWTFCPGSRSGGGLGGGASGPGCQATGLTHAEVGHGGQGSAVAFPGPAGGSGSVGRGAGPSLFPLLSPWAQVRAPVCRVCLPLSLDPRKLPLERLTPAAEGPRGWHAQGSCPFHSRSAT